jgi:undecaprenyl-diphosphatase
MMQGYGISSLLPFGHMDLSLLLQAIILGIVEGLTEFLPISSTGHLIVVGELIGFPQSIEAVFTIFIQLGAVLAVLVFFARDLIDLLRRAGRERGARHLLLNVLISFVPAAVAGLLLSDWIQEALFSTLTVAVAMIGGGIIMLLVEWRPRAPTTHDVETIGWSQAVFVGVAQIASLWPGFSRSASTIIGGLLGGMDRTTAVRFSFYLSIPTLGLASIYSLAGNLDQVEPSMIPAFIVGLATSFVVALIVIRFFLRYVAHHDLKPFAWYRIGAGLVLLGLTVAGIIAR